MSDQETYLAVLKASYDYDPQPDAEDEIAIKENQILLLLEKVDDDWWKVKVKQDDDAPPGLVPAAYVEPYNRISAVKAQYDYDAQNPGELSIKEDELLYVYDKDDGWLLVHSQKAGGKVGFVPENYVEEAGDDSGVAPPPAASQIVVPDSPPKPSAPYVDPEDLVAATANKSKADKIQTWSVSEIDKKGKKKKGTLGVGNGAVYFASESDKTPVQQWQTSILQSAHVDKGKHVIIEVGGPSPMSLHFHAGSKDIAEAIVEKLKASKELSSSAEIDPPERPRSSAAKSVHFETAPAIIPAREPSEDGEEPEEEVEDPPARHEAPAPVDGDAAVVLYDFTADGEDELSVKEGESLVVLERDADDWWRVRNTDGLDGVVPASYIELLNPSAAAERDKAAEEAKNAAAEEEEAVARRAAEEAEAAAKKEDLKKQAAAQRAKAAAAAAEAERKRRDEERATKEKEQQERDREHQRQLAAEAEAKDERPSSSSSGRNSSSNGRTSTSSNRNSKGPPPNNTRIWHDRSGQFRVDAAFLGFANGKLRLHKSNGVVIEVPSEKMSPEDIKYVEKLTAKRDSGSSPSRNRSNSDDDEPLASRRHSLREANKPQKKKGPKTDWFDFFLSAGCDVDDCTRYASSFERDKIDESILPDITEGTMRSLGLREGDIIRVKKEIDKRKPKDTQEQRDADLAKKLQEEENAGRTSPGKFPPVAPAPNLFAGPNGALKQRRGRPQPSKSLPPPSVDITAISAASDQVQRTGSPSLISPATPVQAPPRSSSVALTAQSGFDDDAWTNRPSSTKPATPTPPAAAPARAPSAPPAPPAPVPPSAVSAPLAQTAPMKSAPTPLQSQPTGSKSLAATTEDDIFQQLARLGELRLQSPAISPPVATPPQHAISPPPRSFTSGMGMGSSPTPMGQLSAQATGVPQQMNNGPRGPFAPVPANQSLLQPLIPTTTGFNSFVPTRSTGNTSPFQPPQQQNFLSTQPTGFPGPMMSNPTGFQPSFQQPGLQAVGFQPSTFQSQPTGFLPQSSGFQPQPTGFQPQPMQGGNSFGMGNSFQTGNFGGLQSNPTGFNPGFGQSPFGNNMAVPPVPPLPQSNPAPNNTAPANVFAQMKAGTFASNNDSTPQSSDKYNALRSNPMASQATGWHPGPGSYGAF